MRGEVQLGQGVTVGGQVVVVGVVWGIKAV